MIMEQQKKVKPNRLPREVYQALEAIVGKEYITEDRAIVETYSRFGIDITGFLKKHAKDPSNIPACVVLPATTERFRRLCAPQTNTGFPLSP